MSVNYQYRYRKICFRGETAFDQNAKIATLNLLSFSPVDYLNMMFVQRYYHKEYNAWFGKSYSEGSMINNEQGYTLILKYNPIRNLIVDLGVDYFSFPWLKYGIDHPSDGFDIFSKISYAIAEKTYLSLYYRIKIKEKNYNTIASENVSDVIDTNVDNVEIVENLDEITDEEDTDPMFAERKRTARNYKNTFTFNMKNIISEHFYGNTVFSMILYKEKLKSLSKGMMLAQSLGYKLKDFDMFFSCAIFDTDDYYSRTYFSDRSLPYSFSIPSLSGNGILFSMNIGFKLFSSLSIYIKAAKIHDFDRNDIGTSLEKIYGCNKTDLGIAMRYKF